MPFKLANQFLVVRPTFRKLPVASSVAVSEGDVLKLVNGRWDLCATNEVPAAVCRTHGTVTGNAAGTVEAEGVLVYGCLFEVGQGAISDANSQPGDTLDINATSDGITTSSNVDVKVYEVDREKNLLYVMFSIGNGAVFPF